MKGEQPSHRPSEKPLQRRIVLSCFCKFGARFAAFARSLLQKLEPDPAKLASLNPGLYEKLWASVYNSGNSGSRIYKNENDERASGAILPNSNWWAAHPSRQNPTLRAKKCSPFAPFTRLLRLVLHPFIEMRLTKCFKFTHGETTLKAMKRYSVGKLSHWKICNLL